MNNFKIPGLEGGQKGRSYEEKEEILGEDEMLIIKKDPQKNYWVDEKDLSMGQNLGNFISDFNIDPTVAEDLENEYAELENIDLSPKKTIRDTDREQKKYGELETYTLDDFKLMEEVSKFKALADKTPGLKAHQPKFEDGKLLTDEQVNEQIEKYRELKETGKLKDYIETAPEADKNLMKECSQFKFFYDHIKKAQKRPTRLDGEVITGDQITKMAQDYIDFKNEKPEEFAELKVKNNEWQKSEFIWSAEEEYKGKEQLVCVKRRREQDKDGKAKDITIKYVVSPIPKGLKLNMDSYFFTKKAEIKINDKFFIVPIELKAPFTTSKKAAVLEKEEKEKVSQ